MTAATDALMQLLCARAGVSAEQLEAVRNGDPSELMAQALRASATQNSPLGWVDEASQLESRLEETSARLRAAINLLRQLADLLGCCPRCWGTNSRCPQCQGSGTPGFRQPGPGLGTWLAPAISRLQPPPHRQPTPSAPPEREGDNHD